jgi:hypothetical protein
MTRIMLPKAAAAAAIALVGVLSAGCGSDSDGEWVDGQASASPTNAPATEAPATDAPANEASAAAGAKPPTKACPLVDKELLPTLFKVGEPKLTENKAVKGAGGVTTYACDVSDAGELFLTVGVAVGPVSGTAEANVSAALEGVDGEPVSGVGEAGAFGAKDGVGTVAGMKTVGGKAVLVFVNGNADDKNQLISVAKRAAAKV